MRQRSRTQRLFAAVFGLWFSIVVAEPAPLHVCPMHDAPLSPAATHHTMHASGVTTDAASHAAMGHALQSHDQPATDIPADHGAHQCNCLGCCAGSSTPSLPTHPVINVQAMLAAVQGQRIDAHTGLRAPLRVAHALPFAHAPPAARAAATQA